ncbi:MAG: hypothetical protein K9J12_12460 [Melioribacteraceae bacterium]|nr:hypothetical protein [Melioribacteraceae bacterium]MCF8265838.1 hypothetical protein [Melioribacteraceae bacterium]MCF8414534.1 hypothetical protein [Melioribacteraceae bacterium]
MKNEDLIKQAKESFPNTGNDVEAVDELARKVYIDLSAMKDKESEEYFILAAKYKKLRDLYKKLYKTEVEKSSFKRVS